MIAIVPERRQDLLRYARSITGSPADPVAVAVNATALLDWAEDAADDRDLRSEERRVGKECVP